MLRHATEPDPFDTVPEMSRRARGVPVWAALRSLGRSGVAALVDRLVGNAQGLAAGISQIDGTEVLNMSSIPRFAGYSVRTSARKP